MPGSEPPEGNDDPENSRENARDIAASIQRDFRLLLDAIDRLLDLTADSDHAAVTALWAAHSAAKRGLQLSELLSKFANDNSKPD